MKYLMTGSPDKNTVSKGRMSNHTMKQAKRVGNRLDYRFKRPVFS